LIIYSSSIEIQGAIHLWAIPAVHIVEVILVIVIANIMIKDDDRERYAELTRFPTSKNNNNITI